MSVFAFWWDTQASGTYMPPLLQTKPNIAIPYLVMVTSATVIGLVGNILIFGAFLVSHRVRVVGNEYAFNLALADLAITGFANPFLIVGVTAGEEWFAEHSLLCEAVASVCLGACICAFLTLTAVTINRYIYVCHGSHYSSLFNRRRTVALCVVCWLIAFLLESANFLGWGDHRFDRKHNSCMWHRNKSLSYTLFLTVGLIGVPIAVMVVAYVLIFLKVRKVRRTMAPGPTGGYTGWAASKENWEAVKSTRTFFLVLVAFIITWGPYAVVNALDVKDTFPLELHLYVSAWAHIHSAVNCVIYGASNVHFRQAYRKVLCLSNNPIYPSPPTPASAPASSPGRAGVVPRIISPYGIVGSASRDRSMVGVLELISKTTTTERNEGNHGERPNPDDRAKIDKPSGLPDTESLLSRKAFLLGLESMSSRGSYSDQRQDMDDPSNRRVRTSSPETELPPNDF